MNNIDKIESSKVENGVMKDFQIYNESDLEKHLKYLNSKRVRIIGDVQFEIFQYLKAITFSCEQCHHTIANKTVVLELYDGKKRFICRSCFNKTYKHKKNENRKSKNNTIDSRPKDYYSRVPLLQQKLSVKKLCPVCGKSLNKNEIQVCLYNNADKYVIKEKVEVLYCFACDIGYADSHTAKDIRIHNIGLHADMFMLGIGRLGKETKNGLWSMINARDKDIVENNKTELNKNNHEDLLKSKDVLPLGTTIYVGIEDSHQCKGAMNGTLFSCPKALINTKGHRVKLGLKQCLRCKKIFIPEKTYEKVKNELNGYIFVEKPIPMTHMLTVKDFVTRINVFRCCDEGHVLKDIKCIIKIIDFVGELHEVEISAAYCSECEEYFILESQYQRLKKKGIIVCKVIEKGYWEKWSNASFDNLNNESTLHMLGYNVNTQKNVSQSQRWRLLEIIVDSEILTRTEICSHLDYLINRSKGRISFENARNKWIADRNHIISYNLDDLVPVHAKTLTIKNYK